MDLEASEDAFREIEARLNEIFAHTAAEEEA